MMHPECWLDFVEERPARRPRFLRPRRPSRLVFFLLGVAVGVWSIVLLDLFAR